MKSKSGLVGGVVLLVIAGLIVFWNESRAGRRAAALSQGAQSVVSVAPGSIDPANDGKLVHVTGPTTTRGQLGDPQFSIAVNVVKYRRTVEMYQWQENKDSSNVTYTAVWSDEVIDSNNFKDPLRHANPRMMENKIEMTADPVLVNEFELDKALVDQLSKYEPLAVDDKVWAAWPQFMQVRFKRHGAGYYVGVNPNVAGNPAAPKIGDLRIQFEVVPLQTVSIVARQSGKKLEPHVLPDGNRVALLQPGTHAADTMFTTAQRGNRRATRVFRGIGAVLGILGIVLVARGILSR